MKSQTEIQQHAKFNLVRYANCWEDADILIKALQPEGRVCTSIGSAGDNSFSLLAAGAKKVHIVEMNPSQLACIHLRIAAYKNLSHHDFLQLHGETSTSTTQRRKLYQICKQDLPEISVNYWDNNLEAIDIGYGLVGKFEDYFSLFRNKIIPLIHRNKRIEQLLSFDSTKDLKHFYHRRWNNLRWRMLFKIFFSRFVMGRLGRDPSFFKYVEGSVADRILDRTKHALTELIPQNNPYLTWILTGKYGNALPHALRPENYNCIKENLDRISVHHCSIEHFLQNSKDTIDAYNLSDIFEYMSEKNTTTLAKLIHTSSTSGSRVAYWNMLAPRSLSKSAPALFDNDSALSNELFLQDKAFFYSAFLVDEAI